MQIAIPQLSSFPTVVLVGLGNIGSQTIDALGRLKWLKRAVLVDYDHYSNANLGSQRILRRDLDQAKAHVQARRLAELNPNLEVIPLVESIANVPRGLLRGSILLSALDSIESRRDACEAAWRMGATVIDGGVETDLGLARVTIYAPAPEAPCFECALGEEDYQGMSVRHLCGAGDGENPPTNGSASLGSLVGALLILELEKLFAGQLAQSLTGRQLVVDVTRHRQLLTRLHRNTRCRFNHACRDLHRVPRITEHSALGETLEEARRTLGLGADARVGVDGHQFAKTLHCPGCGASRELLALPERLPLEARSCRSCAGREMFAVGFKKLDRIGPAETSAQARRQSLRTFGIRAGDVLVAGDGTHEFYFEVAHE